MDFLTVTDVIENAFCRKFTYYSHVLGLKQYEQKRGTVMSGRQLHEKHERQNRSYQTILPSGKKIIALKLHSEKMGLVGKIDEAVEASDEIVLVERKYSDYYQLSDTLKTQIGLLSLLLEENLAKPVRRAIVIYSKGELVKKEVIVDESIREFALFMLEDTRRTIASGISPPSQFDGRCVNCTFRKVCPVGLLNTGE